MALGDVVLAPRDEPPPTSKGRIMLATMRASILLGKEMGHRADREILEQLLRGLQITLDVTGGPVAEMVRAIELVSDRIEHGLSAAGGHRL